jgi:hypothetical protein
MRIPTTKTLATNARKEKDVTQLHVLRINNEHRRSSSATTSTPTLTCSYDHVFFHNRIPKVIHFLTFHFSSMLPSYFSNTKNLDGTTPNERRDRST